MVYATTNNTDLVDRELSQPAHSLVTETYVWVATAVVPCELVDNGGSFVFFRDST